MKSLRPTILAAALFSRHSAIAFAFIGAAALVGTVHAQVPAQVQQQAQGNKIESVDVVQRGPSSVVRFHFQNALKDIPANFSIAQPASVTFDFPDTINSVGYKVKDIAQGELRGMRLIDVGERTRAVFSLRAPMSYQSAINGNVLEVVLTPATMSAASQPAPVSDIAKTVTVTSVPRSFEPVVVAAIESSPSKFSEGDGGSLTHSIRDIDFRRGNNGEGRVIIDLSDNAASVDIKQKGKLLVVEFGKTTAADALKKKINVTDFGTPVRMVTTSSSGGKTTMIIEPTGDWKYNAYQADKRLIIEVASVVNDPTRLVQGEGQGYHGQKISLNFQNIDIRALLNVIADYTKLNIIASDSVQGNITLRLNEVPWDQAMDIILQARGLDMRKNDSVIWVAPREEIAKREKDTLEARQQISDIEPVRTEKFRMNFAKASELAALLNNEKQKVLTKRGSVVVDPRTNQLFVTDIASSIESARKIIEQVDIYMRQVQIEARIVEATDTFSKNLGARLGVTNNRAINTLGGGTNVNFGGNSLSSTGSFSPGGLAVNLPATASSSGAASGVLSMVLFNNAATRFLNLELSALEADGRGKIISSPRVVTQDQEQALIEQGTELPYQAASSSGATAVSFRKANLSLQVRPQITPDGNIIMEVEISKDAPGAVTAGGIAISTKHVKTKVLIENGGTVVIGGIYTQDERTDVNKIPVLGDVPIVGNLFRNRTKSDNKTELLIFLTPMILDSSISASK
jgi:type IV pilus assembly protein PilQ